MGFTIRFYENIGYSTVDAFLPGIRGLAGDFTNGWPDSYDFVNQFAQSDDPPLKNYGDTIEVLVYSARLGGVRLLHDQRRPGRFPVEHEQRSGGSAGCAFSTLLRRPV